MSREISNSYVDKWNYLVSKIIGDTDIYDYHINIEADRACIVEEMTKGSVRLQMGMVVPVPESEKMEEEFINLVLP
jgi:hypothetical protein